MSKMQSFEPQRVYFSTLVHLSIKKRGAHSLKNCTPLFILFVSISYITEVSL